MQNNAEPTRNARLTVISNRLPFEITQEDETLNVHPGSGGLVTALAPVLKNRGGIWIGWPGPVEAKEHTLNGVVAEAGKSFGFQFAPVYLSNEEVDLYYHGFSNEIIWPLFHDLLGQCNFDPNYWECYQAVNAKFAKAVIKNGTQGDFIWVQDYHLMLLGDELRKRRIGTKIGFFLHIPFPPLDIFLKLPWRLQILHALLKYDLIGFQTARDKRNFIHCVRALVDDVNIVTKGPLQLCRTELNEVSVGAFPISIDFREFMMRATAKDVADAAWCLHEKWPGQQLVLSLDRLDYTKGIPQRLAAIRTFLTRYPEFHKKVSFIQIIVPSRTDVPFYQELKKEIDRLVGEINSLFTKDNWVPINYMFRSLDRVELLAYYRTAEIALVTPIKDGMNLVAKEYLACDIEQRGALILSEFAGAASQLYSGAILVNPFDIIGIAEALHQAITMPHDARKHRSQAMRRVVRRYDIYWWTKMYLGAAFGLDLQDLPIVEEYQHHK